MLKSTLIIRPRSNYFTKDGANKLYLYYMAYRRSSSISLNINIFPDQWNAHAKKVINHSCAEEYNKIISQVNSVAQTIYFENYLSPLTTDEFRIR